MKKFAIGFLLIFLDFNLNLNQFSLNVLPDFVGYWLLLKGMEEMKGENPRFESAAPFAIGMVIYTAILWVGNLLGASGGMLMPLLSVIAMAAHFYIAWVLILALRELEQYREADLYSAVLCKRWKILLGINVAIRLLRVLTSVGTLRMVLVIAVVLALAGLIWSILFVLGWNRTAELWAERQAASASEVRTECGTAEETTAEEPPVSEE